MHEPTLSYRYAAPYLVQLGGKTYRVHTDPHGRLFIGDAELSAFVERCKLRGDTQALRDLRTEGLYYTTAPARQVDATDSTTTAWQLHRERRLNTQSRRSRTHRWI